MGLDPLRHKQWSFHPRTNVKVYMYLDEPGVFLDAHGNEVSASLAKEAGFDTDYLVNERKINEAKKKAFAEIEEKLRKENTQRHIVASKGDYRMIKLGRLDSYMIENSKGQAISPTPLPKEHAQLLLNELVPDIEVGEQEVKEPKKAKKSSEAEASAGA